MKSRQKLENTHLYTAHAADVRKFFGGDLARQDAEGAFKYKKGGSTLVYSKDKKVAELWLQLLEENDAIRARWESSREGEVEDNVHEQK